MTPEGWISRPSGGGWVSSGTEPHAVAAPRSASWTSSTRGVRAMHMVFSEPVRQEAHDLPADDLPERMLSVLVVEQVEGHDAHRRLPVAEKAVPDPRVEQRVRIEVVRLVHDALLLNVDDLFGPCLRRHEMDVDLAVESRLRSDLHAAVQLVHAGPRVRHLRYRAPGLVVDDVHERVVSVDVEALDGEDARADLGPVDVVLLTLVLVAAEEERVEPRGRIEGGRRPRRGEVSDGDRRRGCDLDEVARAVVEEGRVDREVVALRIEIPELGREDLLGLHLRGRRRPVLATAGVRQLDEVADVRLEKSRRPERRRHDAAYGRLLARMKQDRPARRLYDSIQIGHEVCPVVAHDGELLPDLHGVVREEAGVVLRFVREEIRPVDLLQAVLGADVQVVDDALAGLEAIDVLRFAVDDVGVEYAAEQRLTDVRGVVRVGPVVVVPEGANLDVLRPQGGHEVGDRARDDHVVDRAFAQNLEGAVDEAALQGEG